MKLRDTCPCGAEFEMRSIWGDAVHGAWEMWLAAHRECREDRRLGRDRQQAQGEPLHRSPMNPNPGAASQREGGEG